MKFVTNVISIIRPIRLLFNALVCAMLLFSNVNFAQANDIPGSKLTDGTAQLKKIEKKAQQTIDNPATDLDEVVKRSQNGLNEVQGAADKNKMYTKETKPTVGKRLDKVVK